MDEGACYAMSSLQRVYETKYTLHDAAPDMHTLKRLHDSPKVEQGMGTS